LILAGILEYVLLAIDFENNKANEYLGAILIAVAFLNAFIECKLCVWGFLLLSFTLKCFPRFYRVPRSESRCHLSILLVDDAPFV
jgi:sodium/potassium-transporting ATPase subunit alpha